MPGEPAHHADRLKLATLDEEWTSATPTTRHRTGLRRGHAASAAECLAPRENGGTVFTPQLMRTCATPGEVVGKYKPPFDRGARDEGGEDLLSFRSARASSHRPRVNAKQAAIAGKTGYRRVRGPGQGGAGRNPGLHKWSSRSCRSRNTDPTAQIAMSLHLRLEPFALRLVHHPAGTLTPNIYEPTEVSVRTMELVEPPRRCTTGACAAPRPVDPYSSSRHSLSATA